MNKTNLYNTIDSEQTMTEDEKSRTWSVISARTFEIPIETSVRKPVLSRLYYGGFQPIMSYNGLFLQKRKYALSAIALLLVVSGTVSTLAQKALPGEKLYRVKIGLNEKMQTTFAFTPEAKALVEADLATRRLEEIEGLALKVRLNMLLAREADEAFNEHVRKLETHLKELDSKSEFGTVVKVGVSFQTRVAVHAAVLKDMEINQKLFSMATSSNSIKKGENLQAVTHLERKVLSASVPIILVTKKAIAIIVSPEENNSDSPTSIQESNGTITLDVNPDEARKYLKELHRAVGAPESSIGIPLPAVIPVFVP